MNNKQIIAILVVLSFPNWKKSWKVVLIYISKNPVKWGDKNNMDVYAFQLAIILRI